PNRPAEGVTTATGHTLRDNPFGQIDVVGRSDTMLLKISAFGQEDFRWFEAIEPNLAFWAGNTESAVYDFEADIIQDESLKAATPRNVSLHRTATASSNPSLAGYGNNGSAGDGNSWSPGTSSTDEWWEVDLGYPVRVSRLNLVTGEWWYHAFHLELSNTG